MTSPAVTSSTAPSVPRPEAPSAAVERGEAERTGRIISIDALRGLVVFTMIFVNDLAGAPPHLVPAWMRHYHGRSGMTFVDLVFPAFLFVVGMSIPFALGRRLDKAGYFQTVGHIVLRSGSLLLIGILMVNGQPDSARMGWSGTVWTVLMYAAVIVTFSRFAGTSFRGEQPRRSLTTWALTGLRLAGFATLIYLTLAYRGREGSRLLGLSPFTLSVKWYGILGLIGWAYLVAAVIFLLFRGQRTALAVSMAILFCLYPADRNGLFQNFWPARYVGFGSTLGSQAAITVGGLLLASILTDPGLTDTRRRVKFALLFVLACSIGAWLLTPLYGINKNAATPAWCLWACAITAVLWLGFYLATGQSHPQRPAPAWARALALAGGNVLLAYLLSEVFPSLLDLLHLGRAYNSLAEHNLASAIARSAGCALLLLLVSTGLNRAGFRLRL